jgi:hypothetical protein
LAVLSSTFSPQLAINKAIALTDKKTFFIIVLILVY